MLGRLTFPDWLVVKHLGQVRQGQRAKPEGNPEEQPCQSSENSVLPDSFTKIYILFLIGFCMFVCLSVQHQDQSYNLLR